MKVVRAVVLIGLVLVMLVIALNARPDGQVPAPPVLTPPVVAVSPAARPLKRELPVKPAPLKASPRYAVKITRVRVMPFTSAADGRRLREVRISWRNTGNRPVGSLWANVMAYDAAGNEMNCSSHNDCVFDYRDHGAPVLPGRTFSDAPRDGTILPVVEEVESIDHVTVAVTSVRPPESQ